MSQIFCSSPIGILTIRASGGAITGLELIQNADSEVREIRGDAVDQAVSDRCERQLAEYFRGERKSFDLPLAPEGTAFQQSVWNALTRIPYGETRSYCQIAAAAGHPSASRAVGGANHRNPIMIVIPCHRVIGADGALVGFGGGLPAKAFLLSLEREVLKEKRTKALL